MMDLKEDSWSDAKKSVVSALLVMHGICVVAVLSANVSPSQLQGRLVKTLAPYTRVFHWDPNFTRFHWTHGAPEHDDHRVLVFPADPASESVEPLVMQFGMRGTLRRARHQELAYFMAVYAINENDDITAALARRFGEYSMRQLDNPTSVRVRLENWEPMPLGVPVTTLDWESRYSAEVSSAAGELLVIKDVPRGEVALPQENPEPKSP